MYYYDFYNMFVILHIANIYIKPSKADCIFSLAEQT